MRGNVRGAGAVAAAMALVVVIAGTWFGYRRLTGSDCSGELRLTVAVTPELAPAVRDAAADWTGGGATVDGSCVAVDVTAADAVEVAAVVAGQHRVTLSGVGQASGTAVTPDVWVPDSSMWLQRLSSVAPGFTPANRASIARSPVVLAAPEPVAAKLGWPDRKLTWSALLNQVTTGSGLRTGIVEPGRDAAGLSGLMALGAAAGSAGGDTQRATMSALRALATGRSLLRQDLLAKFPQSTAPAEIASSLGAAALSEEDVIGYNARRPPVPLAALYLDPAPTPLDYPYAVLPGVEPGRATAAQRLFDVLNSAGFRDRLGARGLRAADGSYGAAFALPRGAPATVGAQGTAGATGARAATKAAGGAGGAAPETTVVDRALSSWSIATQPGRMLAVVDVSGSMLERVPTAGGATRSQVTLTAAGKGLDLLDDSWAVGLWTFSTELSGDHDYRELVPIGPLSSQRDRLEGALSRVVPKKDGDTGLYDTVLAAYRTVLEDWQPGRSNSVVIFTDGQNDDAHGVSQQELLADLKALLDPERPIQVVVVGIGQGVSRAELESITKVTGGGVFVTEDPAKIGDVFLKAIALRPTTAR